MTILAYTENQVATLLPIESALQLASRFESGLKAGNTTQTIRNTFIAFLASASIDPLAVQIVGAYGYIFPQKEFIQYAGLSYQQQHETQNNIQQFCLDRVVVSQQKQLTEQCAPVVNSAKAYAVFNEGIYNALDSLAQAAFFTSKYQAQYPAIASTIFTDTATNRSFFAIIDNGFGAPFIKPSKTDRFKGLFFFGGKGKGLLISNAKLACLGQSLGAVVFTEL